MQLVINNFAADLMPVEPSLPFLDYGSWDESTATRDSQFNNYQTWRYELDEGEAATSTKRIRMVFLSGPSLPTDATQMPFDIGRFRRIGNLLAEQALASHFSQKGFVVERNNFENIALRPYISSPDDAIELATGVSYLVQRPFREDAYRFAVAFRWVVQAHFKQTLANAALAGIFLRWPQYSFQADRSRAADWCGPCLQAGSSLSKPGAARGIAGWDTCLKLFAHRSPAAVRALPR